MRFSLAVTALVLFVGCDFRCHTKHYEVNYHAAYTTQEEGCYGDSPRICIPYAVSHPARCVVSDVCDFRCKTLDAGRAEAHERHEPRWTALVNLDPQLCTDGGQVR